ncbi:MAG: pyridoxamine 5'-phosphate oxidase family protein, partial [Bacteroidia bacterium]|nr:pyridoxamine 5'-phosphate oxidase family protein [Bacteroidia bacterium]
QHIFFIGTAMKDGRVNISPKGMDTFKVINSNKVIWLNLTGSGNETATHIQESNRMTIMFCSFEDKPLILRLYGKATVYHPKDKGFKNNINQFTETVGARQIFELDIELVQTSCGFAVPFMDFVEERTQLKEWSVKKGDEGIKNYWKDKNSTSLDGHDTKI